MGAKITFHRKEKKVFSQFTKKAFYVLDDKGIFATRTYKNNEL